MKSIFHFPFFFSFTKNLKINSYLFLNLILGKVTSKLSEGNFKFFYYKAYSKNIRKNIIESHNLYEAKEFKENYCRLLKFIDEYFERNNIKYSIIIVPQYYDLKLKKSRVKYIKFYKNLRNKNIIDMSEEFLNLKIGKSIILLINMEVT